MKRLAQYFYHAVTLLHVSHAQKIFQNVRFVEKKFIIMFALTCRSEKNSFVIIFYQ